MCDKDCKGCSCKTSTHFAGYAEVMLALRGIEKPRRSDPAQELDRLRGAQEALAVVQEQLAKAIATTGSM